MRNECMFSHLLVRAQRFGFTGKSRHSHHRLLLLLFLWPHRPQPLVCPLKLLNNIRLDDRVGDGGFGPLFLVKCTYGDHDLRGRQLGTK